jgi:putative hydrolase of the HAD superfamily
VTEFRCVVFDVDDTLYLERDYVRSGFRAVGEWARLSLGIEDFSDRAWRAFERGVRRSTFGLVLRECGVEPSPGLVDEMVGVYRSHRPDIELTADSRACLDALQGRVVMAAVTDGPLVSQRTKADALGLRGWMDPLLFTEELGPGFGKPEGRAFELIEEATGRSGPACVYVADNPVKDFGGPKQLGWGTVRVRRPESLHHAIASGADVDGEVRDLSGWQPHFQPVARGHRIRQSP